MAATSSALGTLTLPQITPSRSQRLRNENRLKLKCLHPGLPPPLNLSRLNSSLSLLSSFISRHPIRAIYGGPGFFPKTNCNSSNTSIRHRSVLSELPLAKADSLRPRNCVPCSLCRSRRGHSRFKTSIPSVFSDESFCCLSKPKLSDALIPCATVGPDEPHAASTALPEGIFGKQDLDLLYSGVDGKGLDELLPCQLPSHPKLYRGRLKNGMRHLILPNKVPPNRFEAHMEVHVGSIDEEDDEQGIAHKIEHVASLGSKKREKLLVTGARSNAYTDFHQCFISIHQLVLRILMEIYFHMYWML